MITPELLFPVQVGDTPPEVSITGAHKADVAQRRAKRFRRNIKKIMPVFCLEYDRAGVTGTPSQHIPIKEEPVRPTGGIILAETIVRPLGDKLVVSAKLKSVSFIQFCFKVEPWLGARSTLGRIKTGSLTRSFSSRVWLTSSGPLIVVRAS
jgi:hypothetical protein